MDDYSASSEKPAQRCLRDVAACDLYVGIIGDRYGSIPDTHNPEKLSFTELEYRQAARFHKPAYVFVTRPGTEAHAATEDTDERERFAIGRLRETVCREHTVAFFGDKEELGRRVSVALHNWEPQSRSLSSISAVSEEALPAEVDVERFVPGKELTLSYRATKLHLVAQAFWAMIFVFLLGSALVALRPYLAAGTILSPPLGVLCFASIWGWLLFQRRRITFRLDRGDISIRGPGGIAWGQPAMVRVLHLNTHRTSAGWISELQYGVGMTLARTAPYPTREEARSRLHAFAVGLNYEMGMHTLREDD